MFGFFRKKTEAKEEKPQSIKNLQGDLLSLLDKNPAYFANLENKLISKPLEEIELEIKLGLAVYELHLKRSGQNNTIILIPPKYEFWTYFLLSIKLTEVGYRVLFVYHKWSAELVNIVRANLSYLKYQNLIVIDGDEIDFLKYKDALILNLSENYKGIPNTIPSYSTAIVTDTADLDYVMAYILQNTFSFAGLKKSNLKRIIIDEKIKAEFQEKIYTRLGSVDPTNPAKLKSSKLKSQIHELVSEAIAEGASLIAGEDNFESDHYRNIVLDEVVKETRAYQKNFFGPVLLLSYSNFEPQELKDAVKQQPSKGLVIFTNDAKFMDMHAVAFTDRDLVLRPYDDILLSEVFENNPTLQRVLEYLKLV